VQKILGRSHIDKLTGVHPQLIEIAKKIIYVKNDIGCHMHPVPG